MTPPFKPVVESDESTANFDTEFTSTDVAAANPFEDDEPADWAGKRALGVPERPGPKPIEPVDGLTSSVQEVFLGFTFSGESSILRNSDSILIDDGDDDGALEEEEDALEDLSGSDDDEDEDDSTLVRGVRRRPGDDDSDADML